MVAKACDLTGTAFEVTQSEVEAYERFGMPLPKLCPEERYRVLLMFSGGRRFYRRSCHTTGTPVYSPYPSTTNIPVVSFETWNNPKFDPLAFGFEYDFRTGFFDQLETLWKLAPRPAGSMRDVTEVRGIQAAYDVKDSFLVFDIHHAEQCAYSVGIWDCRRVIDCLIMHRCDHCYECADCHQCSFLRWGSHCSGCKNSYFLANCTDCTQCLFCANLVGKTHCVFNQQVSEEDYRRLLTEWQFISRSKVEEGKERFSQFLREQPLPHIVTDQPEGNSGNYLWRCRGAVDSFECAESTGLHHCRGLVRASNCIDGMGYGDGLTEAVQFIGVGNSAHDVMNCIDCGCNVSHLRYCSHCEDSAFLLGCVGLRGKEYCIFNKQYSAADYQFHYDMILQHLKRENLWGEFFPARFSPFPYNASLANDRMPLSRVQAKLFGFLWDEAAEQDVVPSDLLAESDVSPDERFSEVPEMLLQVDKELIRRQMYLCELTGKPFQFSVQELTLYEQLQVALPARCFEQRQGERRRLLSSGRMENRQLGGTDVQTAFPADWWRNVVPYDEWSSLTAENSR